MGDVGSKPFTKQIIAPQRGAILFVGLWFITDNMPRSMKRICAVDEL
jgi:hypothetical protein